MILLLCFLLCVVPSLGINGAKSDDLPDFKWSRCFNDPDVNTYCGDLYFYAAVALTDWYYYNLTSTNNRYYTYGDQFPCPLTSHEINLTVTWPINVDPNGANCWIYCYMAKPPTLAPFECTPGYSPVIRVQIGKRYKLTFHNAALGELPVGFTLEQMQALETDNIVQPNGQYFPLHMTNLHIHGIHQSGMGSHDNVLKELFPGQCFEYVYQMQMDMYGGVHWYHPHFHGKVVFQVFGGAFGFFLQEDSIQMLRNRTGSTTSEAYPSLVQKFFLERAHERLLLAYIGFNLYMGNGNPKGAEFNLTQGQWHRLRVLHVNAESVVMWAKFNNAINCKCEIFELAFDGVYSRPMPYDKPAYPGGPVPGNQSKIPEPSAFMFAVTGAERVEYAIRCNVTGIVEYKYGVIQAGVAPGHIANFRVIPGPISLVTPFGYGMVKNKITDRYRRFNPLRPACLEDVHDTLPPNATVEPELNVSISLTYGVNDMFFLQRLNSTPIVPLKVMKYGPKYVQQVRYMGSGPHPIHMHQQHQQIHTKGGCGAAMKEGQFYDTVGLMWPGWDPVNNATINTDNMSAYDHANDCVVRWRNIEYSGLYVMHCHVLDHEDIGLVAFYIVESNPAAFERSSQFTDASIIYDCCVPLPGVCSGNVSCSKDTVGWDTCYRPCNLAKQPCNVNEVCLPGVDKCVLSSWVAGAKELCDATSGAPPSQSSQTNSSANNDQPFYPWIIMAISIAVAVSAVIGAVLFVKHRTGAYHTIFLEEMKMNQGADVRPFSTPSSGFTPTGLDIAPVPSRDGCSASI